jgi:predicted DNA-binding protein
MYALYTMRRTQIYLDEDQHARLAALARQCGTTTSQLIRDAIDVMLEGPGDEDAWRASWRAAVEATAGIAPYLGGEYECGRVADLRRQREHDDRRDKGIE